MTYSRFSGLFDPVRGFHKDLGWETDHISHPDDPSGPFEVDQLDDHNNVLTRTACALIASACGLAGDAPWDGIVAYVPLVPKGAALRLRDGDTILHQVDFSPERPTVEVKVDISDERIVVRWTAQHDRPLFFNVGLFIGRSRVFPLVLASSEHHVEISPASFPGGDDCYVGVVATDGVRSTSAITERFELPQQPPVLHVYSPKPDASFRAFEPVPLHGVAVDRGGLAVAQEELVWRIDGEVASTHLGIEAVGPLAAGSHDVEFVCRGVTRTVSITVEEPSEEETAWAAAAEKAAHALSNVE